MTNPAGPSDDKYLLESFSSLSITVDMIEKLLASMKSNHVELLSVPDLLMTLQCLPQSLNKNESTSTTNAASPSEIDDPDLSSNSSSQKHGPFGNSTPDSEFKFKTPHKVWTSKKIGESLFKVDETTSQGPFVSTMLNQFDSPILGDTQNMFYQDENEVNNSGTDEQYDNFKFTNDILQNKCGFSLGQKNDPKHVGKGSDRRIRKTKHMSKSQPKSPPSKDQQSNLTSSFKSFTLNNVQIGGIPVGLTTAECDSSATHQNNAFSAGGNAGVGGGWFWGEGSVKAQISKDSLTSILQDNTFAVPPPPSVASFPFPKMSSGDVASSNEPSKPSSPAKVSFSLGVSGASNAASKKRKILILRKVLR